MARFTRSGSQVDGEVAYPRHGFSGYYLRIVIVWPHRFQNHKRASALMMRIKSPENDATCEAWHRELRPMLPKVSAAHIS